MAKTYAIADLHGRFDLLTKAYDAIIKHAGTASVQPRPPAIMADKGTIVHLGDYVDRGPESRQIIEFLINPLSIPAGMKRVVLRGNHEDIMLVTCVTGLRPDWWISNGGGYTLMSYGHPRQGEVQVSFVPEEHLRWINDLPYLYADEHRVFVHAWVNRNIPLGAQDPEKMAWTLYHEADEGGHTEDGQFRHVVHGHHQFEDGPKLYKGRTDLDTFAWATGRIVIGVFDDDKPGGPIEIIEIIDEPDKRWSKIKLSL